MGVVYGKGLYEVGKYKSKIDCKQTPEYEIWKAMLRRCYSKDILIINPSYVGCTVSKEFLSFQYFAEWCNAQIGFENKSWCLDKDILLKGNKVYCENSCCFVPAEINTLFTKNNVSRGEYPIGVNLHKNSGKFVAQCNFGTSKRTHLGVFDNTEDAFNSYKKSKERFIKIKADIWKDEIDAKVYQALHNYEVNIND